MAREAYGTFRHPAVAPLAQLGAEHFRAGAVPRPDARLQGRRDAAARAADGPRAGGSAASAPPSSSRPRATPAAPRSRRSAAARAPISSCCYPHGRISDVQRRMMTTAADDNVHALAIDGTFDDCQALVKGMFNHHAFRDRVRLSGVNSINWARIVAQVVYYFTAAVALGAPHRKVAFTVPTGNFGDIFAGYVAAAHGPADRPAGDRHQRQRHSGPHARDRHLRDARRGARPSSPSMDIQVSSNFERLLFEAYGRDAAAVRALMGSLAQSRRFALSARGAVGDPRAVHRRPRRRGRDRRDHPHRAARDRLLRRSAHRGRRSPSPKRKPAIRRSRWSCSAPRIRPSSPTRSRRPAACARRLPDWLVRPDRTAGARRPRCRPIRAPVEKFILAASRAAREGAAA